MKKRMLLRGSILVGCVAAGMMTAILSNISCTQKSDWQQDGEVVPAGEPESIPGTAVLARYWGEADPSTGRLNVYKIYPGNMIYRSGGRHQEAINYNYDFDAGLVTTSTCTPAGACLPSSGTVELHTDQAFVVSEDSTGACHSNGQTIDCATAPKPCRGILAPKMFCAPIEMISNYSFALSDVVLQITSNPSFPNNFVHGCVDDGSGNLGLCSANGVCGTQATSSGNAPKVDCSATSNLTSPIQGSGSDSPPTKQCSWCYGNVNKTVAYNVKGMRDTVIPGLQTVPDAGIPDGSVEDINTDSLAMLIDNDTSFGILITVRSSLPKFNTPQQINPALSQITLKTGPAAACSPVNHCSVTMSQICATSSDCPTGETCSNCCVTRGQTKLTVQGGAWGPPGACLTTPLPPASCLQSGAPGSAYSIRVPATGGGTVALTGMLWSDTSASGLVPSTANFASGQQVQVVTPVTANPVNSDDTFKTCGSAIRVLTTTLTAIGSSAGLLGSTIVIAGGRTSATTDNTDTNATKLFTLPTSSTGNGSVSNGPAMITSRWGAASATVNGVLYVAGGAHSQGHTTSCTATAEKLTTTSGPWQALPSLPVAECNAAGLAVGKYFVVVPGSSTPYANSHDSVNLSNAANEYWLDTSASNPQWSLGPAPNYTVRFNQAGVGNGTYPSVGNNAIVVGGADSNLNVLSSVDVIETAVGGQTLIVAGPSLPAARSLPAVADVNGLFFVFGGGTSADGGAAGTNTFYAITDDLSSGAWSTLTVTGSTPVSRSAHLAVVAQPSWAGEPLIYLFGGVNSGSAVTTIEEYTP